MRADLHVHSNASDGTDPPAEVMRRAAQAGLDVVALTDHDTVAGHAQARRALPAPLILMPGMELSCRLDTHDRGVPGGSPPRGQHSRGVPGGSSPRGQHSRGVPGGSSPRGQQSVHLLAYLFDPGYPELAAELARIRDDRVLRARAMVRRLADLGVGITWDQVAAIAGEAVVGRPHIARAMAASGAIASPGQAFTPEWIADGGRAYVDRYALDPVRAIGLVRAAGGVAVLAHPRADRALLVSDEQIAGLAAAGLAGVEVFHPDQPACAQDGLLGLARELGLIATGGSDDHGRLTGYRIGSHITPAGAYEALLALADAPGGLEGPDGYCSPMAPTSPLANDLRTVFHEELDPGQRSALLSWLAVSTTFAAVRGITYSIKAGRGPFRNLSVGGEHLHHYMWGIGLLAGVGAVAVRGEEQARRHPVVAVCYGSGLALVVDEFALLLDLRDVYWARQGRISVDLGIGAIAAVGCYFAGRPFVRSWMSRRRARHEPGPAGELITPAGPSAT